MRAILANRARSIWKGKARSLAVTLVAVLKSLKYLSLNFVIGSKRSAVDSEEQWLSIRLLQGFPTLSLA